MKDYSDRELLDRIDQSLKATAEDVREGRVPLDGRVRLIAEEARPPVKPAVPDAAE